MSAKRMNYNELASSYGAHRRPNPAVLELLHELAREAERPRLLEIGVGTGNFASALVGLGVDSVAGIDPSIAMIAQVPEPAVKRVLARAEALPFPAEQFTLLYSVDVIHHLIDRDAAAGEAFRVLQRGGQIAIVTDSETDVGNRIPLATYFAETVPNEIARYPRIELLETELSAAGFVDIERRHTITYREVTDIAPYRDKAFSSLHLISDEAHARGIEAMERDLAKGPLKAQQPYTVVVGRRP